MALRSAATTARRCGVGLSLDCCAHEALGFIATTAGKSSEEVLDLMTATIEHCFGGVDRFPSTIKWLTDHGCCYTDWETCRSTGENNLEHFPTTLTHPDGADWGAGQGERSERCGAS
jgi:putative transposase